MGIINNEYYSALFHIINELPKLFEEVFVFIACDRAVPIAVVLHPHLESEYGRIRREGLGYWVFEVLLIGVCRDLAFDFVGKVSANRKVVNCRALILSADKIGALVDVVAGAKRVPDYCILLTHLFDEETYLHLTIAYGSAAGLGKCEEVFFALAICPLREAVADVVEREVQETVVHCRSVLFVTQLGHAALNNVRLELRRRLSHEVSNSSQRPGSGHAGGHKDVVDSSSVYLYHLAIQIIQTGEYRLPLQPDR